jgi:hypothetical protein
MWASSASISDNLAAQVSRILFGRQTRMKSTPSRNKVCLPTRSLRGNLCGKHHPYCLLAHYHVNTYRFTQQTPNLVSTRAADVNSTYGNASALSDLLGYSKYPLKGAFDDPCSPLRSILGIGAIRCNPILNMLGSRISKLSYSCNLGVLQISEPCTRKYHKGQSYQLSSTKP